MDFRKIRIQLGLSQVEFAKAIGVTINTYLNWERGVMQPNKESQEKLDAYLLMVWKELK